MALSSLSLPTILVLFASLLPIANANLHLNFVGVTSRNEGESNLSIRSIDQSYIDRFRTASDSDVWPKVPALFGSAVANGDEELSRLEAILKESDDGLATGDRSGISIERYRLAKGNINQSIDRSPGSDSARSRRQLPQAAAQPGGVRAGLDSASVLVNAEQSNVTVAQVINITSGRSIVDIRQDPVRMRVLSEQSNVRLDPRETYVNLSMISPYVIANVTDRITMTLISQYSEAYVNAQAAIQIGTALSPNPNILITNGPSNLTLTTRGGALVQAMALRSSQVAVRLLGEPGQDEDEIRVDSRIIPNSNLGANFERELTLSALSVQAAARLDAQLLQASLWIKLGQIELQISSRDHEILIFTGVYTIRVQTLLSPFRIRVTSTIVELEIDNSTITADPISSNVTGHIPNSLLLIRPDNGSRVQLVANERQSALEDSAIDLESRDLTLRVQPAARRVWAESLQSNALITSRYTSVGLRANRSTLEVLAGNPYMRALTGNTSVEIRAAGGPLTLPGGQRLDALSGRVLVGEAPSIPPVNPPFVFGVGPQGLVTGPGGFGVFTFPPLGPGGLQTTAGQGASSSGVISSSSTSAVISQLNASVSTGAGGGLGAFSDTPIFGFATANSSLSPTVSLVTESASGPAISSGLVGLSASSEAATGSGQLITTPSGTALSSSASTGSLSLDNTLSPGLLSTASSSGESISGSPTTIFSTAASNLSPILSESLSTATPSSASQSPTFLSVTESTPSTATTLAGTSSFSFSSSTSFAVSLSLNPLDTSTSSLNPLGSSTLSPNPLELSSLSLNPLRLSSISPNPTDLSSLSPNPSDSSSLSSTNPSDTSSLSPLVTLSQPSAIITGSSPNNSLSVDTTGSAVVGNSTAETFASLSVSESSTNSFNNNPFTLITPISIPPPFPNGLDTSTGSTGGLSVGSESTASGSVESSSSSPSSGLSVGESTSVSVSPTATGPSLESTTSQTISSLSPTGETSLSATNQNTESLLVTTTSGGPLVSGIQTGESFATEPLILIESEIITVQVPPMNMTTTIAPNNISGAPTDFVIAQFSLITGQSEATTNILQSTTASPESTSTGGTSLESISGPSFEALTLSNQTSLDSPVSKEYLLSVGVKVRRSTDSYSNEFYRMIREGLTQAYVEGKDRQLGVQQQRDPVIRRNVRAVEDKDENDTLPVVTIPSSTGMDRATVSPLVPGLYQAQRKNVADVKITSIDRRNPDETKVRFYMVNDNRLIEANRAKETFDQLTVADLSSFLTYPVVESIQPYISDEESQYAETNVRESRVIMAVLVAIGSLLFVSLILSAFCYRHKKKLAQEKEKQQRGNQAKDIDVERGVSRPESVANVTMGSSGSPRSSNDGMERAQSKKVHLAELPVLSVKNSGQLIRELSARDLEDYDRFSYTELFDYVQPETSNPTSRRLQLPPAHTNRIKPLPAPSDVQFPSSSESQAVVPWRRNPSQQRIMTMSPNGRRRLARQLLDAAFPLANVNIDELIGQQQQQRASSSAFSTTANQALPSFSSQQYYTRRF